MQRVVGAMSPKKKPQIRLIASLEPKLQEVSQVQYSKTLNCKFEPKLNTLLTK